jgi:O-acetyl-ADP-ribose deacetylase (regulator of RNase III)
VEGEAASGFRPVLDLARCVHNVLAETDRLNAEGEELRSVVLPLLGTGGGHSDLRQVAEVIIGSAVDYLAAHTTSGIQSLFVLAHTERHRAACELALEAEGRLVAPRHFG